MRWGDPPQLINPSRWAQGRGRAQARPCPSVQTFPLQDGAAKELLEEFGVSWSNLGVLDPALGGPWCELQPLPALAPPPLGVLRPPNLPQTFSSPLNLWGGVRGSLSRVWELGAPNRDSQGFSSHSLFPTADTEPREESRMFYWVPGDGEGSVQGTARGHFLASSSLERVLMISSFLACSRSSRRFRASLVLERRASAWSLRGGGCQGGWDSPTPP